MPNFPTTAFYYRGKSNTELVISPGPIPADKWLADKATNGTVQFEYTFGPEGNNEVVIPKGKIVAAAGMEYDIVTEKMVPRVKICDEDDVPLGVAHHNVYKYIRDQFSGNNVNILTREYIKVPYFFSVATDGTAEEAAAAIKWGACWYESDTLTKNDVIGKYVVSDAVGNFKVIEPTAELDTDSVNKIMLRKVGQVYAVETDLPPAGYLQFFMGMVQSDYDDLKALTGATPSPGRTMGSGFGDIAQYPYSADSGAVSYQADKYSNAHVAFSDIVKGIPFLTDGRFKARAERSYSHDDFTDIWVQGNVTDEGTGQYECTNADDDAYIGSTITVKIEDELAADTLDPGETITDYPELNNLADLIAVYMVNDTATWEALDTAGRASAISGGTAFQVATEDIHVNYHDNVITVYLVADIAEDDTDVPNELIVEAVTIKDNVAGTPTMQDWVGAVGEIHILLQK